MNRQFIRLARFELFVFLRRPLTWLVLGALFIAMLIGAHTGAERVAAQEETLENLIAQEQQSRDLARAAAKRYGTPSALRLEYHRDPTDAFGYMNYFLVTHAYKMPAPLASLAVGQSDLLPFYERVDFTTVMADSAYEPGNPRTLAAGTFDLAFVLVYLVPLAVIALSGMTLGAERDSGVLRMIAAQPSPARHVAAARFGGPALITALLIVSFATIALFTAGSSYLRTEALPALGMVAFSVAGYVLFWFAACATVATLWRGAVQSVVILVCAWIATALVVPLVAALSVTKLQPAPSRIAYVDASRRAMDEFYANESRVFADYFAARPQYANTPSLVGTSALKRFARDEAYRAPLIEWEQAFDRHRASVGALTRWLRTASPSLALESVLQTAAGTDASSYERFAASSREYTKALRQFFEPIALGNAARGEKWSCNDCPGRMNFTEYERVPRYVPEGVSDVLNGTTGLHLLAIWLMTTALTFLAARRLRTWPE